MAKYLDIAKKTHKTKCASNPPNQERAGDSKVRTDEQRFPRDKSDISDRSLVRVASRKPRHATLTVGEVLEEINTPNTGAAIQAEHYRRGSITKENAIVWITKAILVRRAKDTSDWRRLAPAVEAALTQPLDCER